MDNIKLDLHGLVIAQIWAPSKISNTKYAVWDKQALLSKVPAYVIDKKYHYQRAMLLYVNEHLMKFKLYSVEISILKIALSRLPEDQRNGLIFRYRHNFDGVYPIIGGRIPALMVPMRVSDIDLDRGERQVVGRMTSNYKIARILGE